MASQRVPEGDEQELGPVAVVTPGEGDALVAGGRGVAGVAGLHHVGRVGVGVFGPRPAPPGFAYITDTSKIVLMVTGQAGGSARARGRTQRRRGPPRARQRSGAPVEVTPTGSPAWIPSAPSASPAAGRAHVHGPADPEGRSRCGRPDPDPDRLDDDHRDRVLATPPPCPCTPPRAVALRPAAGEREPERPAVGEEAEAPRRGRCPSRHPGTGPRLLKNLRHPGGQRAARRRPRTTTPPATASNETGDQ